MSKAEKLLLKLVQARSTFVWTDLVTLLTQLGYEKKEMAGSRVRFYHPKTTHLILLHKPHPENYIKGGALKSVKESLKQENYL
ncbi:type II toxin-antitoxin system HicA family toxin [Pasteurellaceae bacterium HPA106]|uniref:type II toxin-antitoxin system HicA family toxin n=1 Tax=Spirabiliibacterium pneumoniae TaxID=221400 RepID=UPI001AADC4C3|nr:type II toxin-antitoxin system HicA family toxin [Spirabiliibacterium pneumoniae]MBE2895520.1 type II toxin-antitoxin system HicA family toxin [Spirabiliibacterium pneumoniae]